MQHRKKVYFFENGVKKLILNINFAAKFKTKFGIIYNVIKIASRRGRVAAPCYVRLFCISRRRNLLSAVISTVRRICNKRNQKR